MTSSGASTHVTLMVMSSQWTGFAGELTSDRWEDRLFAPTYNEVVRDYFW